MVTSAVLDSAGQPGDGGAGPPGVEGAAANRAPTTVRTGPSRHRRGGHASGMDGGGRVLGGVGADRRDGQPSRPGLAGGGPGGARASGSAPGHGSDASPSFLLSVKRFSISFGTNSLRA